jgi:3-deoxy-D-manno-octulosonic-acid transferase
LSKEILMGFIYNIGLNFYQLGIFIASFFNDKVAKLRKGQSEAFDMLKSKVDPEKEYIWFHAASLGEFEQGRPVIEKLKKANPNNKILLTFFSPSGYEIRKNYSLVDVICYLPLDTKNNVNCFFKTINISKAVFIKYEFWPNYLSTLKKKDIPFYSISTIFRADQIFFKNYGGWYRNLLKSFTHIFVQDISSLRLLEKYAFTNATIAGDTRFDRVSDLASQAKKIPVVEEFVNGSEKVIVAGSTWPKDEELLVKYMKLHPEIKLILVPHEIHDAHLMGISKLLDGNFIKYTDADTVNLKQTNCLVVNTIGLLSSIYQYANVAYIGGGFGVGIHNTLEAAVWTVPVVFGPNYNKFREARELIALGGGFSISGYDELKAQFNRLLSDKNAGLIAGNYVKENTGATDLIIQSINA